MGCSLSRQRPRAPPHGLELRMQLALKEIIAHRRGNNDDTWTSFNRIVLKFPVIRVRRAL